MDLYIDLLDPKDGFFISVAFGNDYISFDGTMKGKRIIKQAFMEKVDSEEPATASWDTLHVVDGMIGDTEHVDWVDKGEHDMINGELYKMLWEKPLPDEVYAKLLAFSTTIYNSDRSQQALGQFLKDLDSYVSELVQHL